jgi:hypothetical protein
LTDDKNVVLPILNSMEKCTIMLMPVVATKTFIKTGSKYDDSPDWTKGQVVFNANARENKYRLWGSSRNLTKIMKRTIKESEEIKWYKIELYGCDEPIKIWQAEPDKMEIMNNLFEDYQESFENLKFI